MEKLKVQKLQSEAKLPERAHEDDAGLDLFAIEPIEIAAGEREIIRTGIAIEISSGYAGLVWDKSGIATRRGLKTLGGVIDAGFRGEVKVGFVNLSSESQQIKVGEKIAQLLIQSVERPAIEAVQDLADSERGERGFGSSGVQ